MGAPVTLLGCLEEPFCRAHQRPGRAALQRRPDLIRCDPFRRQIDPPAAEILLHVPGDVGQLHGDAQVRCSACAFRRRAQDAAHH